MNAKELKKYRLLKGILPASIPNDKDDYLSAMREIMSFDAAFAYEIWEYYLLDYDKSIKTGSKEAALLVDETRKVLGADIARFARALTDIPAIRNAVLRYGVSSLVDSDVYSLVYGLIASGKTLPAEECLKALQKNESASGSFGEFLLKITSDLIAEYKAKAGSGKVSIPRKISGLVCAYAEKLKAAQCQLIKQRFKEL